MKTIALLAVLLVTTSATAEVVVVERVIDGDTFVTNDGRHIRLHGIDTPEIQQANGGDAWLRLNRLRGKKVELRNVQSAAWDRESAIVVVDGQDVAIDLLRRGLAYVDDRYCDEDLRTAYGHAFELGKEARLGVWSEHVPPWEFRDRKTTTLRSIMARPQVAPQPVVQPVVQQPWRQVTLYWTQGCAPCERIKPEFARVASELRGQGYTFSSTGQRADAFRAGVQTYPAIVVRENGREVTRLVGPAGAQTIRNLLSLPRRVLQRVRQRAQPMQFAQQPQRQVQRIFQQQQQCVGAG